MADSEADLDAAWAAATRPTISETSGLAIASLVLSLLPTCGIGSALALVLGFRARREIDAPASNKTGRGMATAGIVLGALGLVVSVVVVLLVATALISGAAGR